MSADNNQYVTINDVGPRDGLQNQLKILSVAERLHMIDSLITAGVTNIEIGAFVSPKAVPAMANTDEVAKQLANRRGDFSALIPNLRGYHTALESGIKTVAMVAYGSNTMAQKNVAMTREQANEVTLNILSQSKQDGAKVIVTIAVAFECPFEGAIDQQIVRSTATTFLEAGADQIVIADTIGAANPAHVSSLMTQLVQDNDVTQLGCHFHDTRALGIANLYAALETGVRRFDASIAGLGGCPFAPGALGNVATEDAVMMLHDMGYETGIHLGKLVDASDVAEALTESAPGGRSKSWLKPFLAKQTSPTQDH